jgi:hypothetical protein
MEYISSQVSKIERFKYASVFYITLKNGFNQVTISVKIFLAESGLAGKHLGTFATNLSFFL